MAKDKERSINPAQQQRKLDKAKEIKKGKAQVQDRRNEKLARRNPDRLQKQVDDLKALESSGEIKPREKQLLADLERDLRAVRKAREILGDKAPQYGNRQASQYVKREGEENRGSVLGKRRHDGERKFPRHNTSRQESSGSETDESVRRIPMPKDTPPPMPRPERRSDHERPTNANMEPLGEGRGGGERHPQQFHSLPPRPAPEARTTYASAPQIRDLKREAVARFVPSVVRQKLEAVKGVGKLVEPEEMDRLEAEGYVASSRQKENTSSGGAADDTEAEARRLADEEARFQRELEMQDMDVDDGSGGQAAAAGVDGEGTSRGSRLRVEIEDVKDEDM